MKIIHTPNPPFNGLALAGASKARVPLLSGSAIAFTEGYTPPFALHSVVQLNPTGGQAQFPQRALTNLMGFDFEVTQLVFHVQSSGAPANTSGTFTRSSIGGLITADIALDDIPITATQVPIWNLGRCEDRLRENALSTSSFTEAAAFAWKLSKPLIVRHGEGFNIKLYHNTLLNLLLNVDVSVRGRLVNRRSTSGKRTIPFVASYVSPMLPYATAALAQTQETDFRNATDQLVHIDRITGRLGVKEQNNDVLAFHDRNPEFPIYTKVRITDSAGRLLVPNDTPFPLLFPEVVSSWEIGDCTIDPGAHWMFYITKDAISAGAYASYNSVQGQVSVAMLGWKEV